MKLIVTGDGLRKCLLTLLQKYPKVEFAVAWASAKTEPFAYLVGNPGKIERAIIGTHFYQTHPDLLDAFVGTQTVRFIQQPDGVFHPKIYLFSSGDAWEALIGSANLTPGALGSNSEVMILTSHLDGSASSLDTELRSAIEKYWSKANPSTKDSARLPRYLGHNATGSKSFIRWLRQDKAVQITSRFIRAFDREIRICARDRRSTGSVPKHATLARRTAKTSR